MASNDGRTENHHYVPQMLLRNFSVQGGGKKPQIHVFDKHAERSFRTGIHNVAAERNFYDFPVDEEYRASYEPVLSMLEENTAKAFAKLLEHRALGCLTEWDKAYIAMFAAAQHMRVKSFRNLIRQTEQMMVDLVERNGWNPSEIEGYNGPSTDDDLAKFSVLFMSKNLGEFARHIVSKTWLLFEAPANDPFWIGDNPVVLHNENDYGPYGNLGFGVRGVQISLPLSPTLALGMWCYSIYDELKENYEYSLKAQKQANALLLLGQNVHRDQLQVALTTAKATFAATSSLVEPIEAGTPIMASADNILHMNSLQAGWASRYVMSSQSDFALARRMMKEKPHLRNGVGLKAN